MAQAGIYPFSRPMPHNHSNIDQGGLVEPSVINHDALLNYVAGQHLVLPNAIASVLNDHNLAVHTALELNKIIWKATPDTLALTLDTAWRDIDVTAQTSANAKFVMLSVFCEGDNGWAYVAFSEQGETTIDITFQGDGDADLACHDCGTAIVKLDASQVFAYKGDDTVSSSLWVKVIGYIE